MPDIRFGRVSGANDQHLRKPLTSTMSDLKFRKPPSANDPQLHKQGMTLNICYFLLLKPNNLRLEHFCYQFNVHTILLV